MTQLKKGLSTRNLMATAILAPMMIVAGCSDNNSSTLAPSQSPSGVSEGVAYDGYLVGATVCVDENLNKACDADEPSATTVAGGKFSLKGLTDSQLLTPLVLEANENTIDEDTGQPVDPNLKYLAPAGSTAVSGFSTVIQMKVESALAAGSTETLAKLKADAAAELASELGVTVDLTTYDPIAAFDSTSGVDQKTAAELHLINKVLSAQIADLVADVAVVMESNSDLNKTAAFGALIESLNPANVAQVVQEFSAAGATATDLAGYNAETITSSGSASYAAPIAPNAAAIEEQAAQDLLSQAELQEAILTEQLPTGATGATAG
ncbi:hypothetical protein LPB19_15125 [Marinobacter salinisoli]|uniref:Uncharacterized protein n=1 Tax=Marinobacter salinisoli TaxID=2769486 RepID=A0ABX7MQ99_9GAMM|nr:hypothetical protein [Marinobacter salinisoli]QSP94491.1 hypothetical protein LPB19_15125 [Marinobacter salinisoli]